LLLDGGFLLGVLLENVVFLLEVYPDLLLQLKALVLVGALALFLVVVAEKIEAGESLFSLINFKHIPYLFHLPTLLQVVLDILRVVLRELFLHF